MSQVQQVDSAKPVREQGIAWLFVAIAVWVVMAFAMLYPSVEGFEGWHFAFIWRIVALTAAVTLLISYSRGAFRIR